MLITVVTSAFTYMCFVLVLYSMHENIYTLLVHSMTHVFNRPLISNLY